MMGYRANKPDKLSKVNEGLLTEEKVKRGEYNTIPELVNLLRVWRNEGHLQVDASSAEDELTEILDAIEKQCTKEKLEQGMEWIDYNSPPKDSGNILLLTKTCDHFIGYYKKSRNLYSVWGIGHKELQDVEITHWMPLPKPPIK
jgi:hypothetical protein